MRLKIRNKSKHKNKIAKSRIFTTNLQHSEPPHGTQWTDRFDPISHQAEPT